MLFIEQNNSLLFETASSERKSVQASTMQNQAAQRGRMVD